MRSGQDINWAKVSNYPLPIIGTFWSYILTELLGYGNVKIYDGSMQEWIRDPAGPVEMHQWR